MTHCIQNLIKKKMHMRAAVLFFLLFFPSNIQLQFDSVKAAELAASRNSLGFLGGYGQSFPGWGETTQRVETFDLVPRYNHFTSGESVSGWFRGYHSTLIEVPVHIVMTPEVSSMIGINFLACYTFTMSGAKMHPYIFGGGGPVYSFADIPEMGSDWNGNYQLGIGLEYVLPQSHNLLFEFRYHHISNGGIKAPNAPLNSCKLLFGIIF
jgi:hypothetical protein